MIPTILSAQIPVQAINDPLPAFSSVFTAKTAPAGVDSFLSFLNVSSPAPNKDVQPEAAPATRALKTSEAVSAFLANTASVSPVPAESQTLPLKLSFNIFGAAPHAPSLAMHHTGHEDAPTAQTAPAQASGTPAPLLAVATPLPVVPQTFNTVPKPKSSPADNSEAAPAPTPAIALPQPARHNAPAPVTSVRPKSEHSRPTNPIPTPAATAAPSGLPAVTALPMTIPVAPTPAPADTPTAPAPIAAEPRAPQSQPLPSIAAGTAPAPIPTPPSPIAFALRIQPNSPPVAAAVQAAQTRPLPPLPVPTSRALPLTATPAPAVRPQTENAPPVPTPLDAKPQATPAEHSSVTEIQQSPAPAPALSDKPASTEHTANAVQPAASHAGQNAASNSDTDAKRGDTPRDNTRSADAKDTPAPAAPPASHESTQSYYIPAASAPPAPAPSGAPSHATQQTAGTVLMPANETPKTGTAHQISISVPAGDQQNVQVRLIDRAGEVRVSVHAPNEEMAGNLRQDLGTLTSKLNQSGFTTEAFTPSGSGGTLSQDQRNADPQPQNQDSSQRQTSERSPQQQNPQQNGHGKRPAWMDELENSMAN